MLLPPAEAPALPDAEATADLLQLLIQRAEKREMGSDEFLEIGTVPWGKP